MKTKKRKFNTCENPETNLPSMFADVECEQIEPNVWTDNIEQSKIDNRQLYLTGDIDEDSAQQLIEQIAYLNTLSGEPITLYINSMGGSVHDGFALCTSILNSTSPIMGFVTGMCASMAVAVLASCCDRVCGRFAQFMVHSARADFGEMEQCDLQTQTSYMLELNEQMAELLEESSSLRRDEWLEKMVGKETYFSANKALEWGLVDEIF